MNLAAQASRRYKLKHTGETPVPLSQQSRTVLIVTAT